MNVFEAVKQSVTTRQAAESYGIKIKRNGMAVCPFHCDKNPSMKLDSRFHCFGCQEDGDVIDFVSRLYGLNLKYAAEKLATDFGVTYDFRGREPPKKKPLVKQKTIEQRYREAEAKCFRVLSDYYHLLNRWKKEFVPKEIEDVWHPRFVEALERSTYVEYLLDTLLSGMAEEKAALVAEQGKEVAELEQRIGKLVSPDAATALGSNECTRTGNDGGTDQGAVGNDSERWREEQSA